jgi:hypothetical protein
VVEPVDHGAQPPAYQGPGPKGYHWPWNGGSRR